MGALPGWYPDPAGTPGKRYWDGSSWHSAIPAPAKPPGRVNWPLLITVGVGLVFVLVVGTAVVHHPSTSSTPSTPTLSPDELKDAQFAAMLIQDGVPFKDHEDAGVIGATVCVYLGQPGTSIASAIVGMTKWRPSLTSEQVGNAVADAVTVYCPEEKP
jgi:hypothetical protein